ncbi:hypothetical protein EIP91_003906 [Steccherinum ochraceum]|uniref:F-box domain-containing protein n=1 Tax=Steccherinum ochraceum TaxID=92696 RepID=A0A4R0RL92_9APHY|nr:hypothetical protein EIP91_003906 [Steccherinum ochraceum]
MTGQFPSPADRLPPELIEHILDTVNSRDLAACTLLSRRWHHCAHPMLFQIIFVREVSNPGGDKPYGLSALTDILLETEPSVGWASLVRGLNVRGDCPESSRVEISDIAVVLTRLPSLEALQFDGVILKAPITLYHSPQPTSLMRLSLCTLFTSPTEWESSLRYDVTPLSTLVEFLKLFGRIEILEIGPGPVSMTHDTEIHLARRYWSRPEDGVAVCRALPDSFSVGKLVSKSNNPLISGLSNILALLGSSEQMQTSLRELEIWDAVPVVRRILSLVGRNLTHLSFKFDWGSPNRREDDPFGLLHCPSLISLHLRIWTPSEVTWSPQFVNYHLPRILAHSSPTIQEWTIKLHREVLALNTKDSTYIRGMNWGRLDEVLSSRSALKRLKFEFFSAANLNEGLQWVAGRLRDPISQPHVASSDQQAAAYFGVGICTLYLLDYLATLDYELACVFGPDPQDEDWDRMLDEPLTEMAVSYSHAHPRSIPTRKSAFMKRSWRSFILSLLPKVIYFGCRYLALATACLYLYSLFGMPHILGMGIAGTNSNSAGFEILNCKTDPLLRTEESEVACHFGRAYALISGATTAFASTNLAIRTVGIWKQERRIVAIIGVMLGGLWSLVILNLVLVNSIGTIVYVTLMYSIVMDLLIFFLMIHKLYKGLWGERSDDGYLLSFLMQKAMPTTAHLTTNGVLYLLSTLAVNVFSLVFFFVRFYVGILAPAVLSAILSCRLVRRLKDRKRSPSVNSVFV